MKTKQIGRILFLVALLLQVSACGSSDPDESPQAHTPASRPAIQTFSIGTDVDHPALRGQESKTGPVRETPLIAMNSDKVEIKPSYFLREQRNELAPIVTRQDNTVCTQTTDACISSTPIYQNQCSDSCHVCVKCSFFGCIPWSCCDTSCQNVHTGDQCTATEKRCTQQQNQWQEYSTFVGLDAPVTVKDATPMKDAALLLSGLKLRFSFHDPNTSASHFVDCALSQFAPTPEADKVTFALRNAEGCPAIFAAGAQSSATLSLVNSMSVQIPYSLGTLIKTWDGRVLAKPESFVYSAAVDFAGTISIIAGVASQN